MFFVSDYTYLQLTILGVKESTLPLTNDGDGEYAQVMTEGVMEQITQGSPKITLNAEV